MQQYLQVPSQQASYRGVACAKHMTFAGWFGVNTLVVFNHGLITLQHRHTGSFQRASDKDVEAKALKERGGGETHPTYRWILIR